MLRHRARRPIRCLLCRGRPRPCRARAASRRGLLFSFFDPTPYRIAHNITAIRVQTPIPPQGASRVQYVIYFGYCPAGVWLFHPIQPDMLPHLKPERRYTHFLRDYSSVHMLSRLAIESDMMFGSDLFSYHTCKYVRTITCCCCYCCLPAAICASGCDVKGTYVLSRRHKGFVIHMYKQTM